VVQLHDIGSEDEGLGPGPMFFEKIGKAKITACNDEVRYSG